MVLVKQSAMQGDQGLPFCSLVDPDALALGHDQAGVGSFLMPWCVALLPFSCWVALSVSRTGTCTYHGGQPYFSFFMPGRLSPYLVVGCLGPFRNTDGASPTWFSSAVPETWNSETMHTDRCAARKNANHPTHELGSHFLRPEGKSVRHWLHRCLQLSAPEIPVPQAVAEGY